MAVKKKTDDKDKQINLLKQEVKSITSDFESRLERVRILEKQVREAQSAYSELAQLYSDLKQDYLELAERITADAVISRRIIDRYNIGRSVIIFQGAMKDKTNA